MTLPLILLLGFLNEVAGLDPTLDQSVAALTATLRSSHDVRRHVAEGLSTQDVRSLHDPLGNLKAIRKAVDEAVWRAGRFAPRMLVHIDYKWRTSGLGRDGAAEVSAILGAMDEFIVSQVGP